MGGVSLREVHARVREVVEEQEGGGGDQSPPSGSSALYRLAVAVGMPDESRDERLDGSETALLVAMHHIASVVQCGVMVMGRSGVPRDAVADPACLSLRRLWRVARRLDELKDQAASRQAAPVEEGKNRTLSCVCEEVVERIVAATPSLPSGFFDRILPAPFSALTAAQQETLKGVAGALREEAGLRRKMVVDRAVATLESFSIRQAPERVRVLEGLTAAARARMREAAEGEAEVEGGASLAAAFRLVRGEVVSLLVERGVGEVHGGGRVKTVRIGHVPDRGGRPEGVSRQAALMPEWRARKIQGAGAGGGKKKQRR